ncbi:hypothetical protein, partial [Pelagibaculum spongiae]
SSVNQIPGHVSHLWKAHAPGMMYYAQNNMSSTQLIYRNFTRSVANNILKGNNLNQIQCAIVHPNEESIFILCESNLYRWSPLTSQTFSFACRHQPITNAIGASLRGQTASRCPLIFSSNKYELHLIQNYGAIRQFFVTTSMHTASRAEIDNSHLAGNPPYLAIGASPDYYLTYTSSAGLMRQKIAHGEQAHPFFDNNEETLDFNAPDISRYIISPCGTLLTLISPTGISTCNVVPIPALIKILSDMESSMKSSMKSSIKSSREAEPSSGCTLL